MRQEGVIKFVLEHERRPLDAAMLGDAVCQLVAWREVMALTGLVGQDPRRYEGAGYGNASLRIGRRSAGRGRRRFLVTGTQTSGRRTLGLDDFALVERYDPARNRVASHGLTAPSSESLTHAAVYDLGPHIRSVLHAHSPVLWRAAGELRLPVTDPSIDYGTPEMAAEVGRLFAAGVFAERRILAMGGHEDGIVVFGRSPEEAGQTLVTWLARAYERACAVGVGRALPPGR